MFYITVFNIFYRFIYLVLLSIASSFSILLLSSFLPEKKICQMQEHYERLLKKAKDELEVLRKQFDMTHQELLFTQKWYAYCLKNMFPIKVGEG